MEKIRFTNPRGESIEFMYGGNYLIESYSGFGNSAIEATNIKGYAQQGYSFGGALFGLRTIQLNVLISTSSLEETYERRCYLARVFNPTLGQGVLRYENNHGVWCLNCYSSFLPEPDQKWGTLTKYSIQLVATQPFWYDEVESGTQLISATGGLTFDFKFDDTITFGVASPAGAIINMGDIPTPPRIVLRGANMTNPRISLVGHPEYLKIDKAISASEEVEITTDYGNKMVKINGASAMRYLNEGSTFFDLPVGESKLSITTDAGEPQVYLYWHNYYAGV